ncbi:hypothetical protein F9K72_07640 [Brucella intermedia]|nr:hypothetical protein F9K77_05215 [Ochrobactrum sp. LMG 5442]KAB2695970.1 hypothetical protein F9K72_07640 [Brucella intermedia]KAB2713496.1 hypothetical protein F9K80_02465 [Brucella intermedia]
MHDARLLTPGNRMGSRAVPSKRSLEPLYLFVFSHYPTQNRFALLAGNARTREGCPRSENGPSSGADAAKATVRALS